MNPPPDETIRARRTASPTTAASSMDVGHAGARLTVQLRLTALADHPADKAAGCDPGAHSFALPRRRRASQSAAPPSAPAKAAASPETLPTCRRCGVSPVDWLRLWQCDPADTDYLIAALKLEAVRLDWWTRPIDPAAIRHILRKGIDGITHAAYRRLASSVGRVLTDGSGAGRPYRDGQQTPYAGNTIYYAQHALACCCRRCMRYWHGIPYGRDLTSRELVYFTALVVTYIADRLPDIGGNGQHFAFALAASDPGQAIPASPPMSHRP